MDFDAFFTLHSGLPREAPGLPEDVAWAARVAGLRRDARICDAGAGPGGDIAALLAAAPEGHVTAIEQHDGFVDAIRAAHGKDPRVTAVLGDMTDPGGPYDFIWCAGALYFLGVQDGLAGWRDALAPGGAVAFTDACWWGDARPAAAAAQWREYPAMTDEAGLRTAVAGAGYEVIDTRRLSDAAWEAYYTPQEARVAMLRPGADAALGAVLDEAESEIAVWRAHRDAFGYLLVVARPA